MQKQTNTLDRKNSPGISIPKRVEVPRPELFTLGNGIKVYSINAGSQDVTKIEFLFDAGSWFQDEPLMARAANAMIQEGTSGRKANELADLFDYYGAFIQTDSGKDVASVSLVSLNKHLEQLMPALEEMLKDSIFPEPEFNIHMANSLQNFQVSLQKTAMVCSRKFSEVLFGEAHPYGRIAQEHHFLELKRENARSFYEERYHAGNCTILASGKISKELPQILEKHFGQKDWVGGSKQTRENSKISSLTGPHTIVEGDAIQSAIRIGRIVAERGHKDFVPLQLLNTVLGGYFGSRLMSNIREDKGYTYGINSSLISLRNASYFTISTEVGKDVTWNAIDEVYKEIDLLQQERIPDKELDKVKSYMSGRFLRSMDGAFALSDRFRTLVVHDQPLTYYDDFLSKLTEITPDALRELAQKYWVREQFCQVVVGNP